MSEQKDYVEIIGGPGTLEEFLSAVSQNTKDNAQNLQLALNKKVLMDLRVQVVDLPNHGFHHSL